VNLLNTRFRLGGLALLTAAALAAPVAAAPLDKYLPADTEVYVSFNFKQSFNSGIAKKLGVEKARDALGGVAEVESVLKDLGFDPFKDLDSFAAASPGGNDQDKGLLIVHGTFDLAKFKAKGEEASKDHADIVKISKVGDHVLYEVIVPGQDMSLWVVIADKNTILASAGKDYILDALKKTDAKAAAPLKSKAFQDLLEKMGDKQTLTIAAMGSALIKGQLGETPAKETLEKLEAVGGGLTMADDLKIEVVFSAKSADDAKDVEKQLSDGINNALTIVGLLAGGQKEFGVVLDLLKSIKVKADAKTVTLKGLLDADAIDKILKKDL
jgi:hypothetical protein